MSVRHSSPLQSTFLGCPRRPFALCSWHFSDELIEWVWLTRDSASSPFSLDLHCDECLLYPFIAPTTYCMAANVPSAIVHTASPIATLNELNVGSSLLADMLHIHRRECMRFAKSLCDHATQRNVLFAAPLAATIKLSCHPDASTLSRRRLCVGTATLESLFVRLNEWPMGTSEVPIWLAVFEAVEDPAWRCAKTLGLC